jgi:hypothetical protein
MIPKSRGSLTRLSSDNSMVYRANGSLDLAETVVKARRTKTIPGKDTRNFAAVELVTFL